MNYKGTCSTLVMQCCTFLKEHPKRRNISNVGKRYCGQEAFKNTQVRLVTCWSHLYSIACVVRFHANHHPEMWHCHWQVSVILPVGDVADSLALHISKPLPRLADGRAQDRAHEIRIIHDLLPSCQVL